MSDNKTRSFVVGAGMTRFTKPSNVYSYADLVGIAVKRCLFDSGLSEKDIDFAVMSCTDGKSAQGGDCLLRIGLQNLPVVNVGNSGASGGTAVLVGDAFVRSGRYNCVLVVGYEKARAQHKSTEEESLLMPYPADKSFKYAANYGPPGQVSPVIKTFGNGGIEHMEKFGTTALHFAKISEKNYRNASRNPYAQFQKTITAADVLKAKTIYGPLTLNQCSPISDGAAALIIVSEDFIKNHSNLINKAVEIVGIECVSESMAIFTSQMNNSGQLMNKLASTKLYQRGGIVSPTKQLALAEVHDSFAPIELLLYESLGFCNEGEAGKFIDEKRNDYGTKDGVVVNPSGGLLAKGHPSAASGVSQVVEISWQLRKMADERQVEISGQKQYALSNSFTLGGASIVGLYKKYSQFYEEGKSCKQAIAAIPEQPGIAAKL